MRLFPVLAGATALCPGLAASTRACSASFIACCTEHNKDRTAQISGMKVQLHPDDERHTYGLCRA